jgi:shikimate dehydrogenase
VIVQATSAGTRSAVDSGSGEALSARIPWAELPASALAFDLVYNPRRTPFLRDAERRGLQTVGGLGMLVRQAALSLELWIGLTPPLEVLFAAASQALELG